MPEIEREPQGQRRTAVENNSSPALTPDSGISQAAGLKPMIEGARMLKRRFKNITTYLGHRITNASGCTRESRRVGIAGFAFLIVALADAIDTIVIAHELATVS